VDRSETVNECVSGMLKFSPCGQLLLEVGV
jgi:hypothetical protein